MTAMGGGIGGGGGATTAYGDEGGAWPAPKLVTEFRLAVIWLKPARIPLDAAITSLRLRLSTDHLSLELRLRIQ